MVEYQTPEGHTAPKNFNLGPAKATLKGGDGAWKMYSRTRIRTVHSTATLSFEKFNKAFAVARFKPRNSEARVWVKSWIEWDIRSPKI